MRPFQIFIGIIVTITGWDLNSINLWDLSVYSLLGTSPFKTPFGTMAWLVLGASKDIGFLKNIGMIVFIIGILVILDGVIIMEKCDVEETSSKDKNNQTTISKPQIQNQTANFCPYCGAKLYGEKKFCSVCGQKIE